MPLNVAHRRRLSRRDAPEVVEVLTDPEVAEPPWVVSGSDLEQVLIQSAWTSGPEHALERAGPGEQDIAILNDIVGLEIRARPVRTGGIARSQLTDLDDRQPPSLFWWI